MKKINRVIRKFKKVQKTFWEMTPEEQYAYVTGVLEGFSPNEVVRKRSQ